MQTVHPSGRRLIRLSLATLLLANCGGRLSSRPWPDDAKGGLNMDKERQRRLAGIGAILGFLVGFVAFPIGASPPTLQNLLENPLIDAGVVILTLGTVACLILWARQSADPDRRAYVIGLAITWGIIVLSNIVAPALGLWYGPYFETRIVPLALLTGIRATGGIGLILLGYRWLAARRPRLALAVWGVLLLLLILGVPRADQAVIDSGVFSFGNGYQIWHDVLLGVVFWVLPLILYETLSRSWRRSRL